MLNQHDDDATRVILASMEDTATRIAETTLVLFIPLDNISLDRISPFVLYSVYQAATVHLRMWRLTKSKAAEDGLNFLKTILGHFNIRWRAAGEFVPRCIVAHNLTIFSGIYLDALENVNMSFPITLYSMQSTIISTKGPLSQLSRR